MACKWVKLASGPMAASWQFVKADQGYLFWQSPNGKIVAKHEATGQWYRLQHDRQKPAIKP